MARFSLVLLFSVGVLGMMPALANPSFTETEIAANGGILKGSLIHKPGSEVVIIVPGSGPTDKDGLNPLVPAHAPYKRLAVGLMNAGISSLRIDKRGMYSSAAPEVDGNAVTMEIYAEDAHNWVRTLRAKTGQDCVWIAGHSEGALVAMLAAQNPEGVCGLFLLSPSGTALGVLLREQLQANPANAPILDMAFGFLDRLEAGENIPVEEVPPYLYALFHPVVQDFLISQMSLSPVELAANLTVPATVFYGDKDTQVTPDNSRLLGLDGRFPMHGLDGADHLLVRDVEPVYKHLDKTIPVEIASFIADNR